MTDRFHRGEGFISDVQKYGVLLFRFKIHDEAFMYLFHDIRCSKWILQIYQRSILINTSLIKCVLHYTLPVII